MKRILTGLLLAMGISIAASAATTPSFPGGETALTTYLSDNMKYPPMARENGVEGVVCVVFTVKADGTIGNIKIKRMVDPDLESEAIRLVKGMPKWTSADDNGKPVDSQAEVNVNFILD